MDRQEAARVLKNLVIFSALREEPLIRALGSALEGRDDAQSAACAVARELYPRGADLTAAVRELILTDDNFYIKAKAKGLDTPPEVGRWLVYELKALEKAASLTPEALGAGAEVPGWRAEEADFIGAYAEQLENLPRRGYGIFARYSMFSALPDGALVPVEHPDPQRLCELFGYEAERKRVLENTRALLSGHRANNVLLYGDAGTGKSSTVKAIVNEYAKDGLRLIQVEKRDLRVIPALMDRLGGDPLKFIIFIDDLSFTTNDRDFTALKTVLEGGVSSRAGNTAVYATSNRRHLVKESFQARQGDEVHLGDTLEEVSSLAARFGLVVTFTKPDKAGFSELVLSLARQNGVKAPEAELIREAEALALRAGGRSPRLARQYIEYKSAREAENI